MVLDRAPASCRVPSDPDGASSTVGTCVKNQCFASRVIISQGLQPFPFLFLLQVWKRWDLIGIVQ